MQELACSTSASSWAGIIEAGLLVPLKVYTKLEVIQCVALTFTGQYFPFCPRNIRESVRGAGLEVSHTLVSVRSGIPVCEMCFRVKGWN